MRDVMGLDLAGEVKPAPSVGQASDRPFPTDPGEQLHHGGIGVNTGDRSGRWGKGQTGGATGTADI
jgi:hypothetical protein